VNKTKQKSRTPLVPFRSGQIWQMGNSNLQIGLVGKRLVHYKHYKGQTKRAPVSLAGKETLEQFLKENQAVLVQE
jgi:hypothetical protein